MNEESWQLSRRKFVELMLLGGLAVQLPWLSACSDELILPKNLSPLNKNSFLNLRALLSVLFPSDGNGPGAQEINADTYILWVLNDPHMDPNENQYLIKKLDLFNKLSLEIKQNDFYNLSDSNQEEVLQKAFQTKWGSKFCSRLLTLIFEALLIHPIYRVNPNEIAWNWLKHDPGFPKANKELSYPTILNKKNEV